MKSQEIRYIEAVTRSLHSLNSYKKGKYTQMITTSLSSITTDIISEMKHSLGIRQNDQSHDKVLREFIFSCK